MPEKIVNLIKEGYNHNKCRILHDGQLSEPFETVSGVRQGCLLSPLLFLIVIDNVLRSTMSDGFRGVNWGLQNTLKDLDYADDICCLSHRQCDMQEMLTKLHNESAKVGLKINYPKTKEVRINAPSTTAFQVDGNTIENVANFTYLRISLDLKVKIFNSNVKSVLLYGSETWFVTEELKRKLKPT